MKYRRPLMDFWLRILRFFSQPFWNSLTPRWRLHLLELLGKLVIISKETVNALIWTESEQGWYKRSEYQRVFNVLCDESLHSGLKLHFEILSIITKIEGVLLHVRASSHSVKFSWNCPFLLSPEKKNVFGCFPLILLMKFWIPPPRHCHYIISGLIRGLF